MAGRSFAIGTCNMDTFKTGLRIAECFTKGDCISEVSFKCDSSQPAEHWETMEKVIDRLLIVEHKKTVAVKATVMKDLIKSFIAVAVLILLA